MGGDARELGLDDTAQAPPVGTVATGAPIALDATLARGSALGEGPAPVAAAAPALRPLYLAVAALGAVNLAYFVWRFLVSASPPVLHPVFQSIGTSDELGVGFLRGPFITLASISFVALVFLVVSFWITSLHRRDSILQLMGCMAVVGGQISLSVTLLTSTDAFAPARALAACVYVLVPLGAFVTLAIFPNGRPVPRASIYLVPLAVVPFMLQARLMLVERGYSLTFAGAALPFFVAFMAFQRHRYVRHASLREQHQIKWLCFGAVAFAAIQAFAIAVVLPLLADQTRAAYPLLKLVYSLLVASSYLASLTCLLFSSARYRVWDIDRVINRTVVYALVTGLLAAAFAVAFFEVRAVVRDFDIPSEVAAVVPFLAVAVLYRTVRRRFARWIDRRFYGIGLDYEAIAAKAVRAAALPTLGGDIGAFDGLVLLGRGGMGAVYRAHNADLAVPVALKVMSPALAGDAAAEARFEREGRILEDLRHPHIVPFLARGHERGLAFIAMQYVDGEDLGSLVRRRGRLPLAEVATIIAGVAEALDAAHARGVVHRDIKPANVFLEHGDPARALVMDFGVAKLVGDPPLAGDDSLVGSLPYTSPEQIQHAADVDGRADIYSLGATAFELVCGRPPFRETTSLGFVMAHLRQTAPDARELEPALPGPASAALAKALAKTPGERFATAGELAAALRM